MNEKGDHDNKKKFRVAHGLRQETDRAQEAENTFCHRASGNDYEHHALATPTPQHLFRNKPTCCSTSPSDFELTAVRT